jgi:hypothetical protein
MIVPVAGSAFSLSYVLKLHRKMEDSPDPENFFQYDVISQAEIPGSMAAIPFQSIDWSKIEKTIHPGEQGVAYWQTLQYPGLRVRIVEYEAGYLADHWCRKGHIVYCLEGSFNSELETGVKLLIIDGDFLK